MSRAGPLPRTYHDHPRLVASRNRTSLVRAGTLRMDSLLYIEASSACTSDKLAGPSATASRPPPDVLFGSRSRHHPSPGPGAGLTGRRLCRLVLKHPSLAELPWCFTGLAPVRVGQSSEGWTERCLLGIGIAYQSPGMESTFPASDHPAPGDTKLYGTAGRAS